MDGGLFNFLQNNHSSGVMSGITSQKQSIYNKLTSAGDVHEQLSNLSLSDQINQLSNVKGDITGIGDSFGGALTGLSGVLNSKKLISLAKQKLKEKMGKNENETKESEPTQEAAPEPQNTDLQKAPPPKENQQAPEADDDDEVMGLDDDLDLDKGYNELLKNQAGGADEEAQEPQPGNENGGGAGKPDENVPVEGEAADGAQNPVENLANDAEKTVNNVAGDAQKTVSNVGDNIGNAVSDTVEAAAPEIEAGIDTASTFVDAIPLVGDIIGGLMLVGSSIFSAIEGSKESQLQDQENTDAKDNLLQDQFAQSKINNMNFSTANVTSALSSTVGESTGSGVF